MKKIYPILGIIILIIIVVCLSLFKNNKVSNTTSISKIYQSSELFTERDLEQTADTAGATQYNVTDGESIKITSAGVYIISGNAENVTIYIEAGSEDKVQLVLQNLSITNENMPCIYIKTADKVFITSYNTNTLKVTNSFSTDEDDNLNAVIYSKQDITLNGTGTLNIESIQNGITGKDDIKITGGTININAVNVAIRANDSIRIADGSLNLIAGTDGLHSEYGDDDTVGYVFIGGGTISIEAGDDCIHGTSIVQIDGGTISLNGAEGIEGTYIQINDGTINIDAVGDGINAGSKSNSYKVTIEINGGKITINTEGEDADGIDSNGDIIITGGIIEINGTGSFDYDGESSFTGGNITVNGKEIDSI